MYQYQNFIGVNPDKKAVARAGNTANGITFHANSTLASGANVPGDYNQQDEIVAWKRSIGVENGKMGRYKRDIMVEEPEEDALKPDVILRVADYPMSF